MKTKTIILLMTLIGLTGACKEEFTPAKPTQEQLAFQDMELGVFVHFSIDAFAERGTIPGQTPASAFNPTELDVNQWVLAAKKMGAFYTHPAFMIINPSTFGYSSSFPERKNTTLHFFRFLGVKSESKSSVSSLRSHVSCSSFVSHTSMYPLSSL